MSHLKKDILELKIASFCIVQTTLFLHLRNKKPTFLGIKDLCKNYTSARVDIQKEKIQKIWGLSHSRKFDVQIERLKMTKTIICENKISLKLNRSYDQDLL